MSVNVLKIRRLKIEQLKGIYVKIDERMQRFGAACFILNTLYKFLEQVEDSSHRMRQVILNFHGLGPPARRLEPGEENYWVDPDFFFEILDLVRHLRDRVSTCFTFDDGNYSDISIGAEGLARHGHKAIFFVLAGRVDEPGSLGRGDIKDLQRAGHFIGSHGYDHLDWRAQDDAGLVWELDTARQSLENITGHRIETAAIPFGRYNRRVMKALKIRHYTRVYSSDGGASRVGQYLVPRTSPTGGMTLPDIENILLGRELWSKCIYRSCAMALKQRL